MKIKRNIQRDKEVNIALSSQGWKVIRFWDFQINDQVGKCVDKVINAVNPTKQNTVK